MNSSLSFLLEFSLEFSPEFSVEFSPEFSLEFPLEFSPEFFERIFLIEKYDIFHNSDSDIHAKRTYRELRLLKHFRHENVISMLDVFTPNNSLENFDELYFVTHLMGGDLNNIIKTQALTDDHVQFFTYQVK